MKKSFFKLLKLKFSTKHFTFILSFFLLLVSSNLYADNIELKKSEAIEKESSFYKNSNIVYQFINDHEYLFTPISTAMAGGIRCGLKCAAIGGIAGIVDELAVYFGLTDKRYLTWGIFGMSTGHLITPSIMSDTVGFAVGILLPTGTLNDYEWLVAPAASAIAGNSIAGISGMINGGTLGLIDEAFISNELSDKHYLTFSVIGQALTKLLGLNPLVSNYIGIVLGLVAASYEKEFISSFSTPIKTANDLYTTYNKFIPETQLNDHIEKHAIALIGGQFLTQLISLKIMGYQQDLTYNFERLNDPTGVEWNNFKSGFTNFAIFIFPYAIGQVFSSSIDDYFSKKLQFNLEDKVRSELFNGENALRLSHDTNNTVLIDNLESDISTAVGSGAGLVTGAVSSTINGAYGVGVVIINSPNIFVYSTLYNKAYSIISEYLAEKHRSYGEKIRAIDSEMITTFKHDTENIRTITERGGIEITQKRLQHYSNELRKLGGEQKLWNIANTVFWSVLGTADYMMNYYLVGNEINKGRIPFENRNKVQYASLQASQLLSWAGRNAQEAAVIGQSLDRIIILEGRIHRTSDQVDLITRINKPGNQLILQNLEVGVENRLLVTIKNLKLDLGRTYAITGETGCGKTSLLSKIKGIKENGVYGKGNIYYPEVNGKTPKIIMLSQQDYFPLIYSLYEVISYPDKIPDDQVLNNKKREEIRSLLEEIGLHDFNASAVDNSIKENKKNKLNLDSKEDWYTHISGGEKKKIIIVSAIIKKPDILILDEIFNGLDQKSTILVQQMLKKYLPNTLMLVVDHHAQDNNYDAFYDGELCFFNKSIVYREIALKTS